MLTSKPVCVDVRGPSQVHARKTADSNGGLATFKDHIHRSFGLDLGPQKKPETRGNLRETKRQKLAVVSE